MKKRMLVVVVAFIATYTYAQEERSEKDLYNHWSIELNVGQNRPIRPFSSGYYTSKPNTYFYFNGIEHYDLGARYMFSNLFGVKADLGYDEIKNQAGSGSLEFNLKQYRLGIQGVMNFSRLLRFESFTKRIGLLVHGGFQFSKLTPQTGVNQNVSEDNGGIILGLTPQYRLTNWLAITGDFTYLNNLRQHFNWDGSYSEDTNNLTGSIYNTSLGLTFYLGDKDKPHADWFVSKVSKVDEDARKRIAEIEKSMKDTDKDGVPDYIDLQNNTPAGIVVDTKGRFIDLNKNGIPDELEPEEPKKADPIVENNDPFKTTLESGNLNINVFFDVNEDMPNKGSENNIHLLSQYLRNYPDAKIKLTGFADVRGGEQHNMDLSKRRAIKLKNFLASTGVNENRMTISAEGVDTTYPSSSKTGLDLARRVSVQLMK
ncbi:OmpA family protein [Flavobacterium sp.]|jgi:OOP family OmpA-OmpF porin|uniref:OmpA family protein n=1 Tax=Flavobacterium sp. TaxID=239 RepID=UPI0037C1553E